MSRTFHYDTSLGATVVVCIFASVLWRIYNKKHRPRANPDEVHNAMYPNKAKVVHNGSCHCKRVRFRIRAPEILLAVDIPSKIRYPRVTILRSDFEPLTHESLLSMYPIQHNQESPHAVGIHTFCSFCGLHLLFSPSLDPKELHVNVNCLDTSNIKDIKVSYHGVPETTAWVPGEDGSGSYSFQGSGCGAGTSAGSGTTSQQPGQPLPLQAHSMHNRTPPFSNNRHTSPPSKERNSNSTDPYDYLQTLAKRHQTGSPVPLRSHAVGMSPAPTSQSSTGIRQKDDISMLSALVVDASVSLADNTAAISSNPWSRDDKHSRVSPVAGAGSGLHDSALYRQLKRHINPYIVPPASPSNGIDTVPSCAGAENEVFTTQAALEELTSPLDDQCNVPLDDNPLTGIAVANQQLG